MHPRKEADKELLRTSVCSKRQKPHKCRLWSFGKGRQYQICSSCYKDHHKL